MITRNVRPPAAASRPFRASTLAVALELSIGLIGSTALTSAVAGPAEAPSPSAAGQRLLAAYPEFLAAVEGNDLVWKNGSRMPLDDGLGTKAHAAWLAAPDLQDMLQLPYPAGAPALPPPSGHDPGRARNAAFFDKMYGDCRTGTADRNLVEIVWLPRKAAQRLKVTSINGVAQKIEAISRALDDLPAEFDRYLAPAAGTFNCRVIAGTERASAHGHGIAIDIAIKHADYWRWSKPGAAGAYPYRNQIPDEIVRIFEAHGFIWGGRWYHYDTMHFEYRPEFFVRE